MTSPTAVRAGLGQSGRAAHAWPEPFRELQMQLGMRDEQRPESRMPDRMLASNRMSGRMPDTMPDRMSEFMSDRMSECQIKRRNMSQIECHLVAITGRK